MIDPKMLEFSSYNDIPHLLTEVVTEIKYAPEVAHSMLQRQAAESTVGAKEKIVTGAAHAVQQAIQEIEANNVCQLTPEAKSALVSNMLIMLCANSEITHVMGNKDEKNKINIDNLKRKGRKIN